MSGVALEIAGVRVDLDVLGSFLPRRYAQFAVEDGEGDWSIAVRGSLAEQVPVAVRHVVEEGGRWRIPGSEALGWLDPEARRGEASGTAVLDTLLRAAVGTTILDRGGLLIHGAALAVDGRAHLCPARSGSGKSTLSARAGHPLSDELSILAKTHEGWVAHATPWWTTRGGRAPLARVYELAWHGEAVVPLPGTPLRHLASNAVLILDTPEYRARALAAAAGVAGAVPFARLVFRPDTDVDALLRAAPL